MAFDCTNHRKPLLFADLFKTPRNSAPESKLDGSSCSSSSTHFLTSCDSSSSGFSTPLYSDLGSSEGEDDDFIAELTRQMAECMLQDDEVVDDVTRTEASSAAKSTADGNYAYSGAINYLKRGETDEMQPNLQIYQVKNQPPVSKEGPLARGRRVKKTVSAQQKQIQKTEHQYTQPRVRSSYSGSGSGSGMQAVFLGGSGPRIGPPGTGVFLPRDPPELKKKSGCSTVLIPTRVLQVLEQLHFKRYQDSMGPPLSGATSPNPKDESMGVGKGEVDGRGEEGGASDGDDMQLPQEWTY